MHDPTVPFGSDPIDVVRIERRLHPHSDTDRAISLGDDGIHYAVHHLGHTLTRVAALLGRSGATLRNAIADCPDCARRNPRRT